MSTVSKKTGTIAVIAMRMVNERLPKALELKKRMDLGETLTDVDLAFLEQVLADARTIGPMLNDDAHARDVAAQMMQLYTQITTKAVENEGASRSK